MLTACIPLLWKEFFFLRKTQKAEEKETKEESKLEAEELAAGLKFKDAEAEEADKSGKRPRKRVAAKK